MIHTLFQQLFSLSRFAKRFIQAVVDCGLIVVCFFIAMVLRLDGIAFASNSQTWLVLVAVVPVSVLAFLQFGLYHTIVRYINANTLNAILYSTLLAVLVMFMVSQFFALPIPRSVPLIFGVLLFCALSGVRYALRAVFRWFEEQKQTKQRVLIYGAGASGRQLRNVLLHSAEFTPVGFIDDSTDLQGKFIGGLKVYASDGIELLLTRLRAEGVLLALPNVARSVRRNIILRLEALKITLHTVPSFDDIVSGRAQMSDLRALSVDELLGRDPVAPDQTLMARHIIAKVVMVTGAGGSIGSELCRQIIQYNPRKIILFELSELALYSVNDALSAIKGLHHYTVEIVPILASVQDSRALDAVLKSCAVQTIYHAAAYKHVPLVEQNMIAGLQNNIFGTLAIAQAAVAAQVETVTLISTDKAVRPTNVMGASKRIAELIFERFAQKKTTTIFSMVRFGNVLGSSGSVIPRFQEQIAAGGPVTVTHSEVTRYFMTISEAAQLVIQASAMAEGGDVFVLDMGKPVKILHLAQRMARLQGFEPYVVAADGNDPTEGDLEIQITGLRAGEKLFEELLIGNDPAPTAHARVMTAERSDIDSSRLDDLLHQIQTACNIGDVQALRRILIDAPAGYAPNDSLNDIIGQQKP